MQNLSLQMTVKGVVGTINLDYRSLFLHFECAVYLYQVPQIADVEADFQETLKDCREISMEDWKNEKFITKLTGRVLRLIAPLSKLKSRQEMCTNAD